MKIIQSNAKQDIARCFQGPGCCSFSALATSDSPKGFPVFLCFVLYDDTYVDGVQYLIFLYGNLAGV